MKRYSDLLVGILLASSGGAITSRQGKRNGTAPYERTDLRRRLALSASQISQLRSIQQERKGGTQRFGE